MKILIGSVFSGLCALSALAMWTQPRPLYPEKIQLVRSSDFHPRRSVELAMFNHENPKLWLTLDSSGNQPQKTIVQSTSGVGADIVDVWGGTQLQTLVEAGVALDITKPAREMGFAVDRDTWPAVRGELTDQGRQYSYPANVNANILVFNKTVFDKMGVPYPKQNLTWDQFWPLAQKLTKRDGANSVFGVAQMGWDVFFQSQHGEYFSPDGTKLLLTGKIMQRAFQMHHDMLFKYRASPTTLELNALSGQGGFGSGGINQFADGRFAMINVGKWALSSFRSAYKDQVENLTQWQKTPNHKESDKPEVIALGSVLLPHFAELPPCYVVSSKSTSINALGPHKTESLQFLKYLASKEYSEIINQGVDALPANPKYVNAGLETGEPALSEIEMHRNTIAAMKYGYQPSRSPFLLNSDVERVLAEQVSRIESDPSLPVATALAAAQDELNTLMQRNLDRDPKLRARYKTLTGLESVVSQ